MNELTWIANGRGYSATRNSNGTLVTYLINPVAGGVRLSMRLPRGGRRTLGTVLDVATAQTFAAALTR